MVSLVCRNYLGSDSSTCFVYLYVHKDTLMIIQYSFYRVQKIAILYSLITNGFIPNKACIVENLDRVSY